MGKADAGKERRKGAGAGVGMNEGPQAGAPSAGARKVQSTSGAAGSTAARVTRRAPGSSARKPPGSDEGSTGSPGPHLNGEAGAHAAESDRSAPAAPERKRRRAKRASIAKLTELSPPSSEQVAQSAESTQVADASLSAHRAGALASEETSLMDVAEPNVSTPTAAPTVEAKPSRSGRAEPREPPGAAPKESPGEIPDGETSPASSAGSGDRQAALRARAATALVAGRDLLAQAAASPTVSTLFHAATGIARVLKAGLGATSAAWLDEYGKDPALQRELEPVYSFFLDRYWRLQVEHADKVPAGPALLVANHSGALPVDGPVLHHALGRHRPDLREPRWLVEDQIYRAPFIGTLLNRLGAVRAAPENALRLLSEERPVIVFPEGLLGIGKRFAERYRLMRFGRGGFAKIALRARAPIVPVAIVGAEEASPLLGKLPGALFGIPYVPITSPVPLPSRWMIRFGEPIFLHDLPAEAADDVDVVQDLTDRTRGAIQTMIAALLEARGSAFAR
ncbi:MAG TPA: 1-acyl-sn-glycerol-3-phosphate acyltransferase [Myxococcaceae bacterium]|nr:1-acyl-sn-glycerol-3-phosphate acyltransferase [Myxococcaceae bacterium]